MRLNLKIFRVQHKLTQEQMADKIGCIRSTYSAIETGKRSGRKTFWSDLKEAFYLSDADIAELKKVD